MTTAGTVMATLAQAQALLPGSRLVGSGDTAFARIHTDTRTLQPGDLFVALRGDRHDGHAHLQAARAAGAVAAIAERGLDATAVPGLLVPDTLAALQALALAWRARHALPLVAVTGSNGKTTVTQMTAAILRAWLGEAALATAGNFNNHIGVPLTLLGLRHTHRAAVVELGMNHPGEIALLARVAAPTVAVVNNAQREHLEFMSSVAAVARENGAVISALPADGTAVLPAADAHLPLWRELAGARRVLTFGLDGQADVTAQARWEPESARWSLQLRTPAGDAQATLHQPGRHNALNALAATAAALAAGAPLAAVVQGLSDHRPVVGRSRLVTVQRGGRRIALVDDSYNANPDSVLAAIDVLAALPAPRWLVLGDMGEVGSEGPRFHAEVGARARQAGIEHFWAAGAACAHAGADRHYPDVDALLQALPQAEPQAASVLVKGSRFMKMERVVHALTEAAVTGGDGHAA